ncbi:hypothetical protein FD755_006859 [Muntiacus reevesi]|uniref:FXYD domain-containing ion transport regulator n=1 Tax=Muntiacus reevesi TaxID=9886 RepID=A0A5J5MZQ8_MUNRE|nr:hypothetical protein FD755_006859 [Muntiacus reevesi]
MLQSLSFVSCHEATLSRAKGLSDLTSTQKPLGQSSIPDPNYDTVQTVGMTLATILFLLGILIILSKCDPFLGSKAPPRGLLGVPRHLQFPYWLLSRPLCPVSLFCSLSLLTGKKVKCRKADSRSESPTCKSCKSELPSSGWKGGGGWGGGKWRGSG